MSSGAGPPKFFALSESAVAESRLFCQTVGSLDQDDHLYLITVFDGDGSPLPYDDGVACALAVACIDLINACSRSRGGHSVACAYRLAAIRCSSVLLSKFVRILLLDSKQSLCFGLSCVLGCDILELFVEVSKLWKCPKLPKS